MTYSRQDFADSYREQLNAERLAFPDRCGHAERLSALRKAWKRGDRETFAAIIFEMIASAYSQSAEEAMK